MSVHSFCIICYISKSYDRSSYCSFLTAESIVTDITRSFVYLLSLVCKVFDTIFAPFVSLDFVMSLVQPLLLPFSRTES